MRPCPAAGPGVLSAPLPGELRPRPRDARMVSKQVLPQRPHADAQPARSSEQEAGDVPSVPQLTWGQAGAAGSRCTGTGSPCSLVPLSRHKAPSYQSQGPVGRLPHASSLSPRRSPRHSRSREAPLCLVAAPTHLK